MTTQTIWPNSVNSPSTTKTNIKSSESKSSKTYSFGKYMDNNLKQTQGDNFKDNQSIKVNKEMPKKEVTLKSETLKSESLKSESIKSKSIKSKSMKDSKKDSSNDIDSVGAKQIVNKKSGQETIQTVNGDGNSDDSIQTVGKLKAILSQLQKSIQSNLNISDDELEKNMEDLGFTMFDLLNPANMKQFVLQVSGAEDITSVLMNEELAQSMNQLLQTVNELNTGQDFAITQDILDKLNDLNNGSNSTIDENLITNINESDANESVINKSDESSLNGVNDVNGKNIENEINDVNAGNEQNGKIDVNDLNVVRQGVEKGTNTKVLIFNNQNLTKPETNLNDFNVNSTNQPDTVISTDTNNYNSTSDNTNNNSQTNLMDAVVNSDVVNKKESNSEAQVNAVDFFNNLVGLQPTDTLNPQEQTESISRFKEITNQIVEQIKVIINPEQTTMELQLNPESLGRINLSLVSKNGIMTAQFTTQNEISKEAIESQMQVLKDNLTNQGLKVESIEVTVSNFDFGQSSQASTNEGQERNSRGRNFIHYEDELENDQTEDSLLLNNLMEQIGSSVDYTA